MPETLLDVEKSFKKDFAAMVMGYKADSGEIDIADYFIEVQYEKYGKICFKWILDLYRKKYDDIQFCIHLLKCLRHIDLDHITEDLITIASESFDRDNDELRELAVMTFENWEYVKGIPLLKSFKFNWKFLDDYRLDVIRDLKNIQRQRDKK
jgi:hypothetical protein